MWFLFNPRSSCLIVRGTTRFSATVNALRYSFSFLPTHCLTLEFLTYILSPRYLLYQLQYQLLCFYFLSSLIVLVLTLIGPFFRALWWARPLIKTHTHTQKSNLLYFSCPWPGTFWYFFVCFFFVLAQIDRVSHNLRHFFIFHSYVMDISIMFILLI